MNTTPNILIAIQLLIYLLDLIGHWEPIVSRDEVPSWDEINISVKQMNNNKAPGMDGITALQILKYSGDKMIYLLEKVIHYVWGK